MMKYPFDPSDREDPASDIELHLKSFRPRPLRLNWDRLPLPVDGSESVLLMAPQAGFSTKQMTLAMAASWLLGVVLGGGCIFWSMSSREDAPSHRQTNAAVDLAQSLHANPPVSGTSSKNPEDVAEPIELPKTDLGMDLVDMGLPVVEDLSSLAWSADGMLSVGSVISPYHSDRFITARAIGSTNLNRSTGIGVVAINGDSRPLSTNDSEYTFSAPASMMNRQQLMREYCRDSDQQVY